MGFKDMFNKVKSSIHEVPADELEHEGTEINVGAIIGAAAALKKSHDARKAAQEDDNSGK